MVPYSTLWYLMVPYGTLWYHMVPYGTLWYRMVPYGTLWYLMVPYGTRWYYLLASTKILLVLPLGYIIPREADSCFCPKMTVSGGIN